MKRKILNVICGALFVMPLAAISPTAQAQHCSFGSSVGGYGFRLSGVVILPGPVPIAAVGRANLDAAGNVSGTESRSVGGGFADETFTGTYSLNADCMGTTTIKFCESGQLVRTLILAIVFDNNSREIRMVQKITPASERIASGRDRRRGEIENDERRTAPGPVTNQLVGQSHRDSGSPAKKSLSYG